MENFQRSDVGLIPRQLVTRADDFFGGRFFLTLGNKFARGQIDRDRARPLALSQDTIKYLTHQLSRHSKSGLSDRTRATPVIDNRQNAKRPPVGQGIMHEIHAPALGGGPPVLALVHDVARCVSAFGRACGAANHQVDTIVERACD